MRDLLVIGQEEWGPVERRNQLLVRALAARNPETRFLSVEQPLRPRQVRRWRLPRVRRVAANVWVLTPLRPIADSLSRRVGDRLECRQMGLAARELALERPIVWSQDPRLATLISRLPGDGLIYDLTDDWAAFEADWDRRSAVLTQISSLVRRADMVLACSRFFEAQARQWRPHVTYLPNAVDGKPSGGGDADSLASVPRQRLGYSDTLHSARVDVSLFHRCRQAEARAGRLLDPSTVFVRSHVYANPTPLEGFGMAAAEVIAFGVPVVTTSSGAAKELVDPGVSGHVVPPDDPAALAEAICSLVADPALAAEMGERAGERARRYSFESMAVQPLDVYRSLRSGHERETATRARSVTWTR